MLTIFLVILTLLPMLLLIPMALRSTRRLSQTTAKLQAAREGPSDQLKQALAYKRKLDFDAKVDWCNDFRQLTGGASYLDPDEPILAIRQGESVGVMSIQERVDALYRLADQGQLTCQHKWSYSLGYGVKQMYCTSCGRKG